MFEGQKRQAGNDEKVMRGRKEDVKTRNGEASWALLKAVPQISRKKRGKHHHFQYVWILWQAHDVPRAEKSKTIRHEISRR